MKERPILMSAPMVRATLDGTKTQTRRIAKNRRHPDFLCDMTPGELFHEREETIWQACPYGYPAAFGNPGHRLWVRETFSMPGGTLHFRADPVDHSEVYHWTPSIFMRRTESRITLELTGVRLQRLRTISEEDARAEGGPAILGYKDEFGKVHGWASYRQWYRWLWEEINGAGSWKKNPWVWVLTFRKLPCPSPA